MKCKCGSHYDNPPATGWRKCVPVIVGAVVIAALMTGAVLKTEGSTKTASHSPTERTTAIATFRE